ncbi:hypothetical protein SUNI508_05669 [Seiridium unicorne]|uniref:Uncharacterized protein n=1 Tax=Seiridium unicorne TaxID=138068 RepID=A0ABR2V3P7_9PEZI
MAILDMARHMPKEAVLSGIFSHVLEVGPKGLVGSEDEVDLGFEF